MEADMLQQILVFAIVAAAVVFAAWRLPGTATRLRYAAALKRLGLRRFGGWLEARQLRAIVAGGCKACGTATRGTVHKTTDAPR
jgi:hypothetical protein